ncbi:MAG: hypothetical protein DDT28_01154 [Dehalococcoidia bacterium]|nr:hypothetical protein [Chloroflexota bacterium]
MESIQAFFILEPLKLRVNFHRIGLVRLLSPERSQRLQQRQFRNSPPLLVSHNPVKQHLDFLPQHQLCFGCQRAMNFYAQVSLANPGAAGDSTGSHPAIYSMLTNLATPWIVSLLQVGSQQAVRDSPLTPGKVVNRTIVNGRQKGIKQKGSNGGLEVMATKSGDDQIHLLTPDGFKEEPDPVGGQPLNFRTFVATA